MGNEATRPRTFCLGGLFGRRRRKVERRCNWNVLTLSRSGAVEMYSPTLKHSAKPTKTICDLSESICDQNRESVGIPHGLADPRSTIATVRDELLIVSLGSNNLHSVELPLSQWGDSSARVQTVCVDARPSYRDIRCSGVSVHQPTGHVIVATSSCFQRANLVLFRGSDMKKVGHFEGHTQSLLGVVTACRRGSALAQWAFAWSRDGRLIKWDLETRKNLGEVESRNGICDVAISEEHGMLFTCERWTGQCYAFDARRFVCLKNDVCRAKPRSWRNSIGFRASTGSIVTGSHHKSIEVFDVRHAGDSILSMPGERDKSIHIDLLNGRSSRGGGFNRSFRFHEAPEGSSPDLYLSVLGSMGVHTLVGYDRRWKEAMGVGTEKGSCIIEGLPHHWPGGGTMLRTCTKYVLEEENERVGFVGTWLQSPSQSGELFVIKTSDETLLCALSLLL